MSHQFFSGESVLSLLRPSACFVALAHMVTQQTLKGNNKSHGDSSLFWSDDTKSKCKSLMFMDMPQFVPLFTILVEGAIALPVTHGGGVLFAS